MLVEMAPWRSNQLSGVLWDLGGIQTCPLGTFASMGVPQLVVRLVCEDEMVDCVEHKHVELMVVGSSEADWLGIS